MLPFDVEACGEDLWASLIREDGDVSTWSIPAASQRSAQDTLREAILYCGRLPRTLIAPNPSPTDPSRHSNRSRTL